MEMNGLEQNRHYQRPSNPANRKSVYFCCLTYISCMCSVFDVYVLWRLLWGVYCEHV